MNQKCSFTLVKAKHAWIRKEDTQSELLSNDVKLCCDIKITQKNVKAVFYREYVSEKKTRKEYVKYEDIPAWERKLWGLSKDGLYENVYMYAHSLTTLPHLPKPLDEDIWVFIANIQFGRKMFNAFTMSMINKKHLLWLENNVAIFKRHFMDVEI